METGVLTGRSSRSLVLRNHLLWIMAGRKSLNVYPNTICAGDLLQSCIGVFLNYMIALMNLLVSRFPPGPVLSLSNFLPTFTASLTLQLELGLYAELRRWCTSPSFRLF